MASTLKNSGDLICRCRMPLLVSKIFKQIKKRVEHYLQIKNRYYFYFKDDLSTLLGMKCSVYHTHKWGGQPSLYNAMVSAIVPMQENVEFNDLQVGSQLQLVAKY